MWGARWDEGQVGCQRALIIFQSSLEPGIRRGFIRFSAGRRVLADFWRNSNEVQTHLVLKSRALGCLCAGAGASPLLIPGILLPWPGCCPAEKQRKNIKKSISCVLNYPEKHPSHSISFLLYVLLGEERNYRGRELKEMFSEMCVRLSGMEPGLRWVCASGL